MYIYENLRFIFRDRFSTLFSRKLWFWLILGKYAKEIRYRDRLAWKKSAKFPRLKTKSLSLRRRVEIFQRGQSFGVCFENRHFSVMQKVWRSNKAANWTKPRLTGNVNSPLLCFRPCYFYISLQITHMMWHNYYITIFVSICDWKF